MTQPGIEPRSPGPLANTLTIMPMSGTHPYRVNFDLKVVKYYSITDYSWHRAFQAQPKELFSQVNLFQSNRNSFRTSHLSLTLVGLNVKQNFFSQC